jgi:hypothetical protein
VSALPYLVGFTPRASIVLLWVAANQLLLTQRMDLPDAPPPDQFFAVMWGHEAAHRAEEVIVCLAPDDHPFDDLVPAVLDCAESRGVRVRDVLVIEDGRWRSLLCSDTTCCPDGGRVVDASMQDRVAAEFAVLGVAPRESREDVESEIARDDIRAAALAVPLDECMSRMASADREQWRDAAVVRLCASLAQATIPATLTDETVADVLVGLTDVRVRDTVLWECVRMDADQMRRAHCVLQEATRCAPDELLPPVATCGAILAWLMGDGARALMSVERGLGIDADYSLATLVVAALRAGLPPAMWRDAMSGLSREDCRMPRHAA